MATSRKSGINKEAATVMKELLRVASTLNIEEIREIRDATAKGLQAIIRNRTPKGWKNQDALFREYIWAKDVWMINGMGLDSIVKIIKSGAVSENSMTGFMAFLDSGKVENVLGRQRSATILKELTITVNDAERIDYAQWRRHIGEGIAAGVIRRDGWLSRTIEGFEKMFPHESSSG